MFVLCWKASAFFHLCLFLVKSFCNLSEYFKNYCWSWCLGLGLIFAPKIGIIFFFLLTLFIAVLLILANSPNTSVLINYWPCLSKLEIRYERCLRPSETCFISLTLMLKITHLQHCCLNNKFYYLKWSILPSKTECAQDTLNLSNESTKFQWIIVGSQSFLLVYNVNR